ncbi:DUF5709 domain-containing protein [Pseudonocardia bannensis]|uniref:DUF5709 domain-containing protein n=1 Tax=Pseudonocardia bannensis TaxID=630973 RepID=UPI001B7CF1A4|nr:DUF5709 domain-containing protein [Pseudonocardia bannensis]
MAQRDYEEQPEAPDLADTLHLENSYTTAGPPEDVDGLDAGYVPPDRPYVLDEDEVTRAGARAGDTLDERLRRERPEDDRDVVDPDRAGRLTAAESAPTGEPADDDDAVDVGIDGGAASAEEAAVHRVDADDIELAPVVDDSPMEDPEVADNLDTGARAERAARDAARDAEADGDPIAGRDRDHRAVGAGGADAASAIDAVPDAAGAAAPASGRTDAGPDAIR